MRLRRTGTLPSRPRCRGESEHARRRRKSETAALRSASCVVPKESAGTWTALSPVITHLMAPDENDCGSDLFRLTGYSYSSAMAGSIVVARRAGTYAATSATIVRMPATAAKANGSLAFTPNEQTREQTRQAVASSSPNTTPRPASVMPSRRTTLSIRRDRRRAPCGCRSPASADRPSTTSARRCRWRRGPARPRQRYSGAPC